MKKEQQEKYLDLAVKKQELYEDWTTIHEDHSFFPGGYWNDYAHEVNDRIRKHNMEVEQEFPENVELMANFILLGF